jgi:hypothetical protein
VLTAQYSQSLLKPALRPELATVDNFALPAGGPYAVDGTGGGKFPRGLVLGCVGGAPASAVWTLTISGSPTGSKLTLTYVADKVYQGVTANLVAAHASVAQLQAVCDAIWGAGNTLVAGTPGTSFTITFQGVLANKRVGGNIAVTAAFTAGTAPAIALARTTPGSSGAGQYDRYLDGGTNNAPTTARAVLQADYLSDPQGGNVLEGRVAGQPYSPPVYTTGIFNVADLTGLDANAVADPGFRLYAGAAITDAGAQIALGL